MNIGLVAHDSKKKLMQNFCIAYRGSFKQAFSLCHGNYRKG